MLNHKEEIGKMDKRVTFQEKIFSTDASNQHKITGWQDIDDTPTVWANVEYKTGSEPFQSDQLVAVKTASINIRHRTDLKTENRAIVDNEIFDIMAIIPIGRKRFLKLSCESGGQYKETET
jgi:SPP1 family predicted phage head-tail adaptor